MYCILVELPVHVFTAVLQYDESCINVFDLWENKIKQTNKQSNVIH
jgi:hypothetical protein